MGYGRPSLAAVAHALGDVDDDRGRADYLAWVAAVKRAGGVTTVAPHLLSGPVVDPVYGFEVGGGNPVVAARYDVSFVFPHAPSATLNPQFTRQPDDWSTDGRWVYYIAPDVVQAYAASTGGVYFGGIADPQRVPGEPEPPDPKWYDDLKRYAKYAGFAIGGLVLFELVSHLPRPRR